MRRILFFVLITAIFTVSCAQSSDRSTDEDLVIVSWNVQNLFDAVEDGTEYPEYRVSNGWKDSLYRTRLSNINKVFSYENLRDADIIVLNEVENESVVRDILSLPFFAGRGFLYYVLCSEEEAAISIAVVSRQRMLHAYVHQVPDARPVLEVGFDGLTVLACHGKSNLEGKDETSRRRLDLARTLSDVSHAVLEQRPGERIAICGDFNETCFDENMMQVVFSDFSSPDRPLAVSGRKDTHWYCFYLDQSLRLEREGSYYYAQNWLSYDNILLSDASDLIDAGVVAQGILVKADRTPNAWIRNIAGGVSDHLPVYVRLRQ